MPEPLFVEETGRMLRLNAGFDMSSNTELSIIFCKPGGTTVTKTTADGVALGTSNITDEDLGSLLANEYVEYAIESGLITVDDAGRWGAQLLYTDTGATPDDNLYGTVTYFTVSERCDT